MAILILGGVVRRNTDILNNHETLRRWLPHLCSLIGMHPVGEVHIQPYGHWEGGAPSAVLFIEESAIIVHTYPERDYLEILLHSCKAICGENKNRGTVTSAIVRELDMDIRYRHYLADCNWRELSDAHQR